jgi:hypothetical protein
MTTYRDITELTQDARGLRERLIHLAEELEKQYGDQLTDQVASKLLFHARSMGPAVDEFMTHLEAVKVLAKTFEGSGGSPEPSAFPEP